MTLEEAIKHAEEVAEREYYNAQVYDKAKNNNLYHPDKITCEQAAKRCRECAAEHRQLAEWLKELKRRRERDVPDTNDGDMISRRVAIDAAEKESQVDGAYGYMDTKSIVDMLEGLPSAQAERPTDIQDILTYLDNVLHPLVSPNNWHVYSNLYDMVAALPSAQPEIIHCRDCKHYWIHSCMDSFPREICDLDQTFYDSNFDYYSLAERRTDD